MTVGPDTGPVGEAAGTTGSQPGVLVRVARPEEYAEVGELTVRAYQADGHGSPAYAERLRDAAGRAAVGELLVATGSIVVTSTPPNRRNRAAEVTTISPTGGVAAAAGDKLADASTGDRLLGTVAVFAAGTAYAQLAGPGETEIRMLAVDPGARGRGVGAALAAACVHLSRGAGAKGVRLSTEPSMAAAHRIYERLGFRRTPDRDWSPVPDATLLTYELHLGHPAAYCDRCGEPLDADAHAECSHQRRLEPPRYCRHCRRRLVVQVTPHGWTARCARHGERSGDQAHLA